MQTQDMPVVDLIGGPRQRGRIYGESQRDRIVGILEHWYNDITTTHGVSAENYIADFVSDTNFLPAIERWAPEVMEEVRGMAEGAGVAQNVMYAFNCMDEEWWYGRERLAGAKAGDDGNHCSAFAIAAADGRPTYVAQTMDIAGWSEGYQVLLRHHDERTGLSSLIFTVAGMLMLTGMNSAGVAVCCNTLLQLERRRDGLPVQFVTRGMMACSSFEDAVSYTETVNHASGQNYTVGGGSRVVALECSANKVAQYAVGNRTDRVWHTNHTFVNDDLTRGSGLPEAAGAMAAENTHARYACLTRRIGAIQAPVTLEVIKATLRSRDDSSHPVSRRLEPDNPNAIGYTAGAMVYILDETPRMELAAGPPCSTAFLDFELEPHAVGAMS
jgi:isopenicillin-N N-acyltransferase-like protein